MLPHGGDRKWQGRPSSSSSLPTPAADNDEDGNREGGKDPSLRRWPHVMWEYPSGVNLKFPIGTSHLFPGFSPSVHCKRKMGKSVWGWIAFTSTHPLFQPLFSLHNPWAHKSGSIPYLPPYTPAALISSAPILANAGNFLRTLLPPSRGREEGGENTLRLHVVKASTVSSSSFSSYTFLTYKKSEEEEEEEEEKGSEEEEWGCGNRAKYNPEYKKNLLLVSKLRDFLDFFLRFSLVV